MSGCVRNRGRDELTGRGGGREEEGERGVSLSLSLSLCVCVSVCVMIIPSRRMLLSHFMKRVSSIGGHKDCCDNCRQRYCICTAH